MSGARRIRGLRPGEAPDTEPSRYLSSHGYIRLRWRVGDEYVECYEHRWVTKCFDPELEVHHLNGVKHDNRPENLVVVTSGEHHAHHARLHGDEVAAMYAAGMSTVEIGAELGADAAVVYRCLIRHGHQPRSISESLRRNDVDLEGLQYLYEHRVGTTRIGAVLGCSGALVAQRVKELGLAPRRRGTPSQQDQAMAEAAIGAYLRGEWR